MRVVKHTLLIGKRKSGNKIYGNERKNIVYLLKASGKIDPTLFYQKNPTMAFK